MIHLKPVKRLSQRRCHARRGGILVLASICLIAALGFVALAVDVGFMTQTKAQMSGAADASALAAALEMPQGWGQGKTMTADAVASTARSAAQAVGTTYRLGEQAAAYLDTTRDVRFGQRTQTNGAWVETWGVSPYNMVEVTIHRDQPLSGSVATRGDQQLPLFFAPAMGNKSASLTAKATAILSPGSGFRITPGSGRTCPALPFALDEGTWNALINNVNNTLVKDKYTYNATTGAITNGPDGIREANLYPESNVDLPPGNRGSIDIGPADNSTADLVRQILYGPNEADLAVLGGDITIPVGGSRVFSGDTGLSAAVAEYLNQIKGKPRAIPIFRSVAGVGNNAQYTVVKWVGIRIMKVDISGSPVQQGVVVQPAPLVDSTVVVMPGALQVDSIMTKPRLIH